MRTKIIATIGPACSQIKTLSRMVQEGVSVFRFNFSHGTMAKHEEMLSRVRKVEGHLGQRVGILQDLEGHRIRTGHLRKTRPVILSIGQAFSLYREAVIGSRHGVSLDYPGSFASIRPPQRIYVDDGKIHLRVVLSSVDRLDTVVEQEGILGERKGVNIPGINLAFPALSSKDAEDLKFATRHKVDFVAQSFVRTAADVFEVKRRLDPDLRHCRVIAKIESREGLKNIASILKAANGIMVARGDLGISIPIYEIPIVQKWIIAACNHLKKPVITATQMLEHMTDHLSPTRAEVSDVANAVIDGTDFVMLSGETAAGCYPIETVRMMRKIIQYTERHTPFCGIRCFR